MQKRREFLQTTAAGSFLCLGGAPFLTPLATGSNLYAARSGITRSKTKVARLYLGIPQAHWPTPSLDLDSEVERYEREFARQWKEFSDVEFPLSELITSPDRIESIREELKEVDGILAIHLSMGIMGIVREILASGKPTMLYAAPYSGHEWTSFGRLRNEPAGAHLDCMLTSDMNQLAVAVRPFRAIHHLSASKILNVIARDIGTEYVQAVRDRFGTGIVKVEKEEVLQAYESVPLNAAEALASDWIQRAEKVVEPSRNEIVRSCRLALAFENLLSQGDANLITVDCYGSMYHQLPAFPCIGFTRLNDMGLGGICESDLQSAMTHLIYQGLAGRPGWVNDPTVDESTDSIILAHCLGSTKMDGPDGEAAPFRLRTIMERQEGAVPQVRMRLNQKVTQSRLIGTDLMIYFTGTVIEVPDHERGCRTKINVKVDGDVESLWQNWSHGLHRVTCYGDITADLKRFCRFKDIQLVMEA